MLAIFGVGLKINSGRFTPEKMEQMIVGKSAARVLGEDPCIYQVTGDPTAPDKRRIRVDFVCPEKVEVNTISYSAVPNTKAKTILTEIARIDWFDPVKVYKEWDCTLNWQRIADDKIINADDEIVCRKKS